MLTIQPYFAVLILLASATKATVTGVACKDAFMPTSAASFVKSMHPGRNLWEVDPPNSIHGHRETDWGNPLQLNSTFLAAKRSGFRGIRLPVTWAFHMMDESPWTIDADWLQLVSHVIDMATSSGLYVLVNAHHDAWASFDLAAPNANYTLYEEKFYGLWYQIGLKLACKPNMVAFEALNKPVGSTIEHAAELNKLHKVFIKAIHDAGGHNSQRVIVIGGLGDNPVNMVQWLETPTPDITNPWALTFHYYSPPDFTGVARGKTIWGSDAERAAVEADFTAVRGNYSGIPIIVGEFGMEIRPSEPAARWKWFDHIVRMGHEYDFAMVLWDPSLYFVADSPDPWHDPTALDILMNAAEGELNALADITEDGMALEQNSSAFVWHRVGVPVTDQSLPFIWNGRTLQSIRSSSASGSKTLDSKTDYVVQGNNITFKASFLSTLFDEDAAPGLKSNLTLRFSGGADLQLQAVQWDTPQPSSTDIIVNAAIAKKDLHIPFEYKGLAKMAAVKARMYNSTYLFDEWTRWLGPLQQARLTYRTHWDFDEYGVVVKSSVLEAVLAADVPTGLTFEFYPRTHRNTVNFTIGTIIS